jgi:anti-sigma B factor antagonist
LTLSAYNDPAPLEATFGTIRVRSRAAGRRTTVAVGGEVDLASVGVLRAGISAALDSGATELWIDLSDTEFIDSSGLHLLIETQSEVKRRRRRMAIVCPPGRIRRVFELSGLADVLPLYDGDGRQ